MLGGYRQRGGTFEEPTICVEHGLAATGSPYGDRCWRVGCITLAVRHLVADEVQEGTEGGIWRILREIDGVVWVGS